MDKVAEITATATKLRKDAARHLEQGMVSFDAWKANMEKIAEWELDCIVDAVRD